jgi:acetyl-CoA carboxylase biotin carboxylase subunit
MEVNTRLQVEHPVTELVTGLDLVKEQISVAANHELSFEQRAVELCGHAVECRINAEDPYRSFKPSPGEVTAFAPPREVPVAGARVRVDTHVEPGYRIPVYYDSMIAKLCVHAPDRSTAIAAMLAALERFSVEGIKTTIPLHREILSHPEFVSGSYDTGLIARMFGGT